MIGCTLVLGSAHPSWVMKLCHHCGQELPDESRFCTRCGRLVIGPASKPPAGPAAEEMNVRVLYVMVAVLLLALLFPPYESPPGQPPEFLGFYFILSPPESGVVSRLLLAIELVTIAVTGFYLSWLFRRKRNE